MSLGAGYRDDVLAASVADDLELALLQQEPPENASLGDLVEASYPGYQRAPVPASAWGAVEAAGTLRNMEAFEFPSPSSGQQLILGWALIEPGGEVRWSGVKTASTVSAADPDPPTVVAGSLVLNLT